ncbi:hypothetical protein QQS21_002290 [Conoideocrella luteorostrata]|uniref:Amine oxidase domain-containing protein n=1 Tax=Conoideocrella luteorostrata TaxID=1105319 RepID=A0AAJ0CYK6_9HYPO|nr:hypothetical protein QQS21_002290 [Conoideocrella luteorostrata]
MLFFAALASALVARCIATPLPIRLEVRSDLTSRLANVHVANWKRVPGPLTFTYGTCTSESQGDIHHNIAVAEPETQESRLVWVIPQDAPNHGCISAWSASGTLLGRSKPQDVRRANQFTKRAAKPISMTEANGFDPIGPWFDGVDILSQKGPSVVDVNAAKAKQIAIVGAGISGLMTYLILHQAGFTNITILEADSRIGGRIHTEYFAGGPSGYSYQELGAMRMPLEYTDPDTEETFNVSDFQIVYRLIEEMNKLNRNNSKLHIDLIPWLDDSDNGLQYFGEVRMPNGLPPTVDQTRRNASLSVDDPLDAPTTELRKKLNESLPHGEFMVKMSRSMYKAHREWINGGMGGHQKGDRWSEFAYLSQYLKGSLNSTDVLTSLDNPAGSFWTYVINYFYESADNWRTINGGFSRLPESFRPMIEDNLRLNTKIERVDYDDNQVTLQWKNHWRDAEFQESTFDYAVVSVPFTVVRGWRLPSLPATMGNAIQNLVYDSCCKVALEYSERFWEKLANPIYGSCSTESDIPGIGITCYPSYKINSTGPAAILGSYAEGTVDHSISRLMTMSDEEHANYVLDAMTEIHGEHTRKLYTGKFARKCWSLDPHSAGAWASPDAGQHELYMPEYFKMHSNVSKYL